MTKVRIEPGICGFMAIAEAEAAEDFMVHLRVASGCAAVQEMMKALGSTFSAFSSVSLASSIFSSFSAIVLMSFSSFAQFSENNDFFAEREAHSFSSYAAAAG